MLEGAGLALVTADTDDDTPAPVVRTAPYGYARLRRETYDEPELVRWAERLGAVGWDDLHVFFKHEDAGAGPRLASLFRSVAEGSA